MRVDRDDLIENAPCGLLITDAHDVVLEVNATFLSWTGYDRADVVGRDFHLMLDVGSQAFYATRYQAELWARSEVREIAMTVIRADGSEMPILVNASMIVADDRPAGVRLAVFDSTNRRDYEREMLTAKRQAETSEASVRVLQEASTLFLAARTEVELGTAVQSAARNAFAAIDVAVLAYEPDRIGYRPVVGEHLRDVMDSVRASRPAGSGALRADEVVLIPSLEHAFARSERLGEVFRSHRAEAFSAVPIADGANVMGAFVCLFGRSRAFDRSTVDLQLALARQAGLALSRVRLQEQLARIAMHDQLTGLANRTLLDQRISHAIAAADRSGESMALVFVDLDGFKQINDGLGHRAGDLVLAELARRMNAVVREADIVGRFGGDEFLVVCDVADEEAAAHVAERLRSEIGRRIVELPDGFTVGASVGIAVYRPGASSTQTADSLVRAADAAMYASKKAGGNRVSFASM